MTTKYFQTQGEALEGIPESILEKVYAGTLTPITRVIVGWFYIVFYDSFGEYVGTLQEDGTIQKGRKGHA